MATTSEYNDNRPQDGQDERERLRAERESHYLQTLYDYSNLLSRLVDEGLLTEAEYLAKVGTHRIGLRHIEALLDKEGY